MSNKRFYKASLSVYNQGVTVEYSEYVSIHETESIHYCIGIEDFWVCRRVMNTDSPSLKQAKSIKMKIRKIMKSGSRIAKPTKKEALMDLKRRKALQITHLERELELAKVFVDADCDKLVEIFPDIEIFPNTECLGEKHLKP